LSAPQHEISVLCEGQTVYRWLEYQIDVDMLEPADTFTLRVGPATAEVWDALPLDGEVQVFVDQSPIVRGYIGTRTRQISRSSGAMIEITGLDKAGRLTRESMNLISFKQKTLGDLAREVASPWFSKISFSNARNRNLLRGRNSVKRQASVEPVNAGAGNIAANLTYTRTTAVDGLASAKDAPRRVDPGQTRWDVLQEWLEGSGLLVWSAGDGAELIIGRPNYSQPAQYRFRLPPRGRNLPTAEHAIDWRLTESVEERYRDVTVVGASRGNADNWGKRTLERSGTATDTTGDFRRAKQLYLQDDSIRSATEALAKAKHELALRQAGGRELVLTMRGHGQLLEAERAPTLYAPDTIAEVVDEEQGTRERWLITSVNFSNGRQTGQLATLRMVPEGTELAL
jgi:prophage tail gpP-like protein